MDTDITWFMGDTATARWGCCFDNASHMASIIAIIVMPRPLTAAGQLGLTSVPFGSTRSSAVNTPSLMGISGSSTISRDPYTAADVACEYDALTAPVAWRSVPVKST